MGKAIRLSLIAIGVLVLLLAGIIIAATSLINPNDFKPEIEKAVSENTNLQLKIGGDLAWSLLPIGIEINGVETTLDGQPFAAVNRLLAKVGLMSLIQMNPQVHTLEVDGLKLSLEKDKQGTGNWTRIAKAKPEAAAATTPPTAETAPAPEAPAAAEETASAEEGAAKAFNFAVEQILISDAGLSLNDLQTGQKLDVSGLSAKFQNITLGEFFPFELAVAVSVGQPKLDVSNQFGGNLRISPDFKLIDVQGLKTSHTLAGEPFGGKSVDAAISGDISADLNQELATVKGLKITLANLAIDSDLTVKGFGKPEIQGKLALAPFSVKDLLAALGKPAPETMDANVLQKVGLTTELAGPAGTVGLKNLNFTLDDTAITGSASYGIEGGAIRTNLAMTDINVDRYLPPKQEKAAGETSPAAVPAGGTATASSAKEEPLLPLETLRKLDIDAAIKTAAILASGVKLDELALKLTARNGLLTLSSLDGKLYQGGFATSAQIDARSNTPKWSLSNKINAIQILPLLKDLSQVDTLEGAVNVSLDVTTSGNTISALRSAAKGTGQANIANGVLHGFSASQIACEGIALANQEKISTRDWPQSTAFKQLNTAIAIDGNTLRNTSLTAEMGGLKLSGEGQFDLLQKSLEYLAGLQVVGEIDKDPACRVTEDVMGIVIPAKCTGSVADGAKPQCGFDQSRFGKVMGDLAKKKAGAKAEKELDKGLNKLFGEDKPAAEGEEAKPNPQKDAIKGALKGLFQ